MQNTKGILKRAVLQYTPSETSDVKLKFSFCYLKNVFIGLLVKLMYITSISNQQLLKQQLIRILFNMLVKTK